MYEGIGLNVNMGPDMAKIPQPCSELAGPLDCGHCGFWRFLHFKASKICQIIKEKKTFHGTLWTWCQAFGAKFHAIHSLKLRWFDGVVKFVGQAIDHHCCEQSFNTWANTPAVHKNGQVCKFIHNTGQIAKFYQ